MQRAGLLTTIGLAALTNVAAAITPIPLPVPGGNARPIIVNRTIFAGASTQPRPTAASAGNGTMLPKHRQPLPAPPAKNGSASGANGKTAAPAMPVNRSTPFHRQPLGW
jgi:hypothetical protein